MTQNQQKDNKLNFFYIIIKKKLQNIKKCVILHQYLFLLEIASGDAILLWDSIF
jgi:hypothetical protein